MDYARNRVNQLIAKNTKILIGLSIVAFIAGILQGAGYGTPGWLVFSGSNDDNATFSIGVGLWYQRLCMDECKIGYINIAFMMDEDAKDTFETYKLVATVAVVFSIFCPIVILVYIRRVRQQKSILTQASTAIIVAVGSGVVALVVVGKIASDVHTDYDEWIHIERDTDFKLGLLYSELLMGLGGALDFLVFIGLCIQIFFRNRDGGDSGEESLGMTSK